MVDRYFERRSKIKKIIKFNQKNIRILKSYLYSLAHFKQISRSTEIKNKFKNIVDEYWNVRKKFEGKSYRKLIKKVNSLDDSIFYPKVNKYLLRKFSKEIFQGKLKIKNEINFQSIDKSLSTYVPDIVIKFYYQYTKNKYYIFKNLKKCFFMKSCKKPYNIHKEYYLIVEKKINFLKYSAIKINDIKAKGGLYRLNWFI